MDKLNLRIPIVEETNRLELDEGITSKSKIKKLIETGKISDWNDPRILTINGLRNRGYSAEMLKIFISKLGYTQNDNVVIPKKLLDSCVREYLNINATRCFCIKNPLKVNIINFPKDDVILHKPLHPLYPDKGEKSMKIGSTILIERDDFRVDANKKYFRLTSKNPVRLKYYGIVKYVSHVENNELILSINVVKVDDNIKVKGTIHWLYEYDHIILKTFNTNINKYHTIIDKNLSEEYYQFERMGYYKRVDNNLYHHLVDLKEDSNK